MKKLEIRNEHGIRSWHRRAEVPAQGAPSDAQPANTQQSDGNVAAANGTATSEPATWQELGVKPELEKTLLEMGFAMPMAVQRAVFPA